MYRQPVFRNASDNRLVAPGIGRRSGGHRNDRFGSGGKKSYFHYCLQYILLLSIIILASLIFFAANQHPELASSAGLLYQSLRGSISTPSSSSLPLPVQINFVPETASSSQPQLEVASTTTTVAAAAASSSSTTKITTATATPVSNDVVSLSKAMKPTKAPINSNVVVTPYGALVATPGEAELVALESKYIKVIPTPLKPDFKQDRRVVLRDVVFEPLVRPPGEPSGIVGMPRALLVAQKTLQGHPLYSYDKNNKSIEALIDAPPGSLEAVMMYIHRSPQCATYKYPIFLSMASVGDDLYWYACYFITTHIHTHAHTQCVHHASKISVSLSLSLSLSHTHIHTPTNNYRQLIENFVYTMVKFDVSDCALVICVSDTNCMNQCRDNFFPCYDYRDPQVPLPSVMEQIGAVKLLHIPKALEKGVDVFMLDLDVGFLGDPKHMLRAFVETPTIDIFVQEDLLFIMNRTKAGWRTWFTEPLPNIGLFLCRGNAKTKKVFDLAWTKYNKMTDLVQKANPGKDQNHVLDGMRVARGTVGLRYAYFSNSTAPLLDKVVQFNRAIELGGEASAAFLEEQHSLAMHSTCYEQSTKVMGLKATNSFWHPKYYDPLRPTITKQILFISSDQVLDEVRSLIWLGIATNRAVITPNLLGSEALTSLVNFKPGTFHLHKNQAFWPGFRVTKLKRVKGSNSLKIQILEPAYYWRVERDYDAVPEPKVVYFDPSESLEILRARIDKLGASAPRIVLAAKSSTWQKNDIEQRTIAWAKRSVGEYDAPYSVELKRYGQLGSVKAIRKGKGVDDVLQGMRNCEKIFSPLKGNRTCFQICD